MSVESVEETLEFIKEWRSKAVKVGGTSQMRQVISRFFDGLSSIIKDDVADLQFLLATMQHARETSFANDQEVKNDPLRQFIYAHNGYLEAAIEAHIERVKNGDEVPRTRSDQSPDSGTIKEEKRDDVILVGNYANIIKKQPMMSTPVAPRPVTSFNSAPPPVVHRTPHFSMMPARKIVGQSGQLPIPRKGSNSVRTLNCPRCTETGLHISGFVNHLRSAHNTTPGAEKVGFKCACGFTGYSYKNVWQHSNGCRTCSLSLIPRVH